VSEPGTDLPQEVRAAASQSFLARLDRGLMRELLSGGCRVDLPPGARVSAATTKDGAGIVLDGLLRLFLEGDSGRQVTVRYARAGEAVGLVHLFGGATATRAQAVTAASLWLLVPSRLRELSRRHAELAVAIAEECAARTADAIDELALQTFGSVRRRLARHLLDLAAVQAGSGALVASVTQQQLADATGSVREVVARALKRLHEAGLTAPSDTGVLILDAAGLDAAAAGQPGDDVT
jgi:CRP/FNR family cyclic AMP-dependent transcriptional regulator